MQIKANNPALKSWVAVPHDSDFPIQNLPFGIFSTDNDSSRVGVAIGNHVLDLSYLANAGFLDLLDLPKDVFNHHHLNNFMSLGRLKCREVRNRVSELLSSDNEELKTRSDIDQFLIPLGKVTMKMPVKVGDYTDFYSSEQHAYNVGCMFRDPDNALLPNWKHIPVGYHGRSSSIIVSGEPIKRPKGQTMPEGADKPIFGPSKMLDFELEMAFITCKENRLGNTLSTTEAEDYIFGMVLFNDWSARDIQKWEYVPLGPFLSKNFASSISPWVVTLDALEPFRIPGPVQDPEVLPYLQYEGNRNIDIDLEVSINTEHGDSKIVSKSNFKNMYWNMAQQLTHHAINGCNLGVGDMYASGTISGPDPGSFGSMLELAWKGTKPVSMPDGSERKFIQDGDTVCMRGYALKDKVKVGFGEVSTMVLPAD